ncbi:MAG: TIGR02206 family membrane protein [Actinomycetota bacterium]|nr:TIGR02206 family membrane protein [Actinomycetota bacterium]
MQLFEPEHVAALVVTAVACAAVAWGGRRRPGPWLVRASRALAVAIAATYVAEGAAYALRGEWSLEINLPLHLTDAATIVAVLALLDPRPILVELTYFWGLTASLQAVITPELSYGFPDLFFFTFFVIHAGVVLAAILLVVGRRLGPRRGAVVRAFLATAAVAFVAAIGSLATGGNYMYLREKPAMGSLLDLMGPWPVYIVSAGALALGLFLLLDAPFRRRGGSSMPA